VAAWLINLLKVLLSDIPCDSLTVKLNGMIRLKFLCSPHDRALRLRLSSCYLWIKHPRGCPINFASLSPFHCPIEHDFQYLKMVAGEHDIRPTCLSDHEHIRTIQNHVLHYLGCIEISERDQFFDVDNALYNFELEQTSARLLRESNGDQGDRRKSRDSEKDKGVEQEAKRIVEEKLHGWRNACQTEMRRIGYLRARLAKDQETRQLVRELEASVTKWKASDECRKFLPVVEKWRLEHSKSSSKQGVKSTCSGGRAKTIHSSESSIRAHKSLNPGEQGEAPRNSMHQSTEDLKIYEPEKDFNLHIIEYRESEPSEGDIDDANQSIRTKRYLSDRKIKIDKILGNEETIQNPTDHPLYKSEEPGKLRYIHLPANNMTVSVFRPVLAMEFLQLDADCESSSGLR
jgi:hypothetical protein